MGSGDEVLVTAAANLWRGVEAVGGRLTLTRDLLSFRAHAANVQRKPLDIPVREIVSMRKYRGLGIIPNRLAVTTADGAEYRFVLFRRDRIIRGVEACQRT